jgi:ribosomal protein L37AE/L43A
MAKCVNCGKNAVSRPNADGFAKCRSCGCSNIIARPEDYAAAAKMESLLAKGWPHVSKAGEDRG